MKKAMLVVAVAVLALGMVACGSSSSDSDNAFPSSVTPSMAEVASSSAANVLSNAALPENKLLGIKALGAGNLQPPIAASTNTVEMIHVLTDSIMSGVATGCNSLLTATSTTADCTATINGTATAIHIDFTAFDLEGTGSNIGTGTASISGTTPMVFRIWKTDGTRLACGRIDTLPTYSGSTLTTSGKGTLYTQPAAVFSSKFDSSVYTKVTYDATVEPKTYDIYITGTMPGSSGETPIITLMHSELTEDSTSVSGSIAYSMKNGGTFSNDAVVGPPANPFYAIQYASAWLSTGAYLGFMNIGYQIDHVTPTAAIPGQFDSNSQLLCANISTGDFADTTNPPTSYLLYTACTTEGLPTLTTANLPTTYNYTAAQASLAQFPTAFTTGY